jgi:nitrogen-specific signal transduction histidine kinase
MKTLLVLGQLPGLAEAVQAAVDPNLYRVVYRTDLADAVPMLSHGLAQVCVVDAEGTEVQGLWELEQLRQKYSQCPILVFHGPQPWPFEEEAYLLGISQALAKPVRPRLLNALLNRLLAAPAAAPAPVRPAVPAPAPPPPAAPGQLMAWQLLKDFSAVLTHSLCAEALLRQFLQFLRENMGVNRAAVFLRPPPATFGNPPAAGERDTLRSSGALGLTPGLLDHFQLSFASGIGGYVARTGRILRRESAEAQQDPEMLKEFEVLGAQVAIPMLDRESLLGVAVFDGHLTGENLANDELEVIFHLLAELGLTVRNIWLHEQLAGNHAIVSDILQQLNSACVVVGRDLAVLQANKKARALFQRPGGRAAELEFSELPQALGSKIFLSLKTGSGLAPFRYHPPERPGTVYSISITPFQKEDAASPSSVLMLVDDLTETEQLQKLELENARLRPLKEIAARLSHEIGNALVPISIHQQLLAEKYNQPEFRASLDQSLADGVRRILRLVTQLKLMARDRVEQADSIPLEMLLNEACALAQQHHPAKVQAPSIEHPPTPVFVAGDHGALREALAEILLNAYQSKAHQPEIAVKARLDRGAGGAGWVHIEVHDNGGGFAPETVARLAEPFFTTRNTGVGLGISVCRRVVESHHGKVEILADSARPGGLVRISLPLAAG